MRFIRLAATIVLAAYTPACTSYQVMADPSAGLRTSPRPVKQVRITLRSGERFVLQSPCVDGDSLQGTPTKSPVRRVALADVAKLEVPKHSEGRTAAFVDAIVLANSDMRTPPPASTDRKCPVQ